MKRLASILALALAGVASLPAAAQADFGLYGYDVAFFNEDGTTATQAGSHDFKMNTTFGVNFGEKEGLPQTEGRIKDFFLEQIPGLVGDTTAYPRCTTLEFLKDADCPLETQVGITAVSTSPGSWLTAPVFNLAPPPGVLVRLGFNVVEEVNTVVDVRLSEEGPHNPLASLRNIPQVSFVFGAKTQLWGEPSDPAYDGLRGGCGEAEFKGFAPGDVETFEFESPRGESCPVELRDKPFLTLPTDCSEPLISSYEAFSWTGEFDTNFTKTHDAGGNPQPFTGCAKLHFDPSIDAQPTSKAAHSPTGLDFSLQIKDEGLTSLKGLAQSRIREAVVVLPEGMTANPSVAAGLEVCSEEEFDEESLNPVPGEGCPQASKIGSIEVESPLVEEPLKGSLFQATPHENRADDALIAFYIVVKNPKLGVIVKQATRVEPDPKTGQLVSIAEEIPPTAAFSSFKLHFREGGRSPLVTPSLCGDYEVEAELTPWSGTAPVTKTSTFSIVSGPNEEDCPPGGTPPFVPGFDAGSANNAAGTHSPFAMRITRRDGDQDLTRFDATFPPGLTAKLAGVSQCSDSRIAAAKTKDGREELASPSCPANSKIGRVLAGAGVGSQLTYVEGSIYLAGPLGKAPLSAVAIVPAVAGPFDVGTVVTRQALQIDPRTAEVTADGALSDPLPHILAGIPLVVRDVQVYVDRSQFSLNPTSCEEKATKASIWGGGANPFSLADNAPVARQARYQAASCASLGFKPKLDLKLRGGTSRGAHPALRGTFKPRPGDANLEELVLRFPRSAFLDQAHIRTICTRVQFAANACPQGAIYGRARAFTPLLSEPLEGPVYLRSSDNELPDVVADLHGLIDVEAVGRVDSQRGGIRVTFTKVPDAPVSKVVVNMQGAKKGLIVNSRNLCAGKNRANVRFEGHNGKLHTPRPLVRAQCGKRK